MPPAAAERWECIKESTQSVVCNDCPPAPLACLKSAFADRSVDLVTTYAGFDRRLSYAERDAAALPLANSVRYGLHRRTPSIDDGAPLITPSELVIGNFIPPRLGEISLEITCS